MEHNESSPKRITHSPECLQKETRETIRPYSSSLTAHLETLEKKESISPKRSRLQEIIKFRAQINQVKTKRTIQRIDQTRTWFFKKINKIDKPLARITREHKKSILTNKIRNERETKQQKLRKSKKPSYPTTTGKPQ